MALKDDFKINDFLAKLGQAKEMLTSVAATAQNPTHVAILSEVVEKLNKESAGLDELLPRVFDEIDEAKSKLDSKIDEAREKVAAARELQKNRDQEIAKRRAAAAMPKQPVVTAPDYDDVRDGLLKHFGLLGADPVALQRSGAFSEWALASSIEQSVSSPPTEPTPPIGDESIAVAPRLADSRAEAASWSQWFEKSRADVGANELPAQEDQKSRSEVSEPSKPMTTSLLNWTKWLQRDQTVAPDATGQDPSKEQRDEDSSDDADRDWGKVFK